MTREEMIKAMIIATNDLLEREDFNGYSDKEIHQCYCECTGQDPFESPL